MSGSYWCILFDVPYPFVHCLVLELDIDFREVSHLCFQIFPKRIQRRLISSIIGTAHAFSSLSTRHWYWKL